MSGRDVHLMLKDKVSGWPHISSITLINAKGKLFNFSRFWPLPEIDVTDREFFKALKSDAGLTSFMGEPVRNRATGSLDHPPRTQGHRSQRRIPGPVLARWRWRTSINISDGVLGQGSQILPLREDDVVLAVIPLSIRRWRGRISRYGPLLNALSRTSDGTVQETISIDGEDRLVVAQACALSLCRSTTKTVASSALRGRNIATYISSAALLLIVVIGLIVLLGVRQIRNYEVLVQAHAERQSKNATRRGDQRHVVGSLDVRCIRAPCRVQPALQRTLWAFAGRREARLHVPRPGLASQGGRIVCRTMSTSTARHFAVALARNESYTHTTQSRDGRIVEIHNHLMPNGGWVGTHEDISERRSAVAEIERTRTFLDTVIENVPVTVFVKDAQSNRYILVNRAAEAMWGISREQSSVRARTRYFRRRPPTAWPPMTSS